MTNKVLVIFTGGTIAMRVDENIDAAVPGVGSDELIGMVDELKNLTEIEVIDFTNVPSSHITPKYMLDLTNVIKKNIGRNDLTGIVVTHGTDVLEETAYFLDLVVNNEKPIILVGSMKNNSELGYDGGGNLFAAIHTACSPEARNKGVLLVMNDEIHSARYVTKTNTVKTDTFKSPEFGPIGVYSNRRTIFYIESLKREFIDTNKLESKVGLIKVAAGMESDIIDFYIENGYKGIVIEAFGCGNLPTSMLDGVKRAINKDIPIVLVSRCLSGSVEPVYGYMGGGKQLLDLGVIFAGNSLGQKARIKLMLVLGITKNIDEIRNYFNQY